ncbi:haloacid dehalogenase-like hydrolase [Vibrio thalassae]|uniref:Haloacid dehalogenase-like hydrolase n=1 Tax=Vibrio thalassae TaxID=1243014 RepID=A0A240EK95_9VIBR|nr:HAD family hydrolase [Vibrio thalassae]SNX48921.1 haloacid dehalogenase-like hydrolase [Vibrio thalassae]
MSKPLYVFDMDETLFDADCAVLWNEFLVEQGIAMQPDFLEQDKRLMALYADGKMDMEDYLEFSIAPLTHAPTERVQQWVEQCIDEKILSRLFPQARALLADLKRDDIHTIIISASVSFLVEAIAKRLGINVAMGIDLELEQNSFTAKIKGIATYREGKVAKLAQWLSEQDNSYTEIHFYTDSINDRPLCEFADYAYLVNPCPALKALGEKQGWKQLKWSL